MQEILKLIDNVDDDLKPLVRSMINEYIYIHGKLDMLKTLPSIEVHPKDPKKQRQTAAGKQYREYLQQKTNIFKALCALLGKKGAEEESPLRAYLKSIERRGG